MTSKGDFIPGCYRNFPQEPEESLRGYLLRLSEANGYRNISALIQAATGWTYRSDSALLREFLTSETAVKAMGQMAVGDANHLLRYLAVAIPDGALHMHGRRMDDDAVLDKSAQVCPTCLATRPVAHEDWDLTCVTVCSRHLAVLVDTCHGCGAQILWNRSSLVRCGSCGADYRDSTPIAANAEATDVSADFAALAPFRFELRGGDIKVTVWDTAFRIYKCLALSRAQWALQEYPDVLLRNLPLVSRLAALELMATSRHQGTYKLGRLVPHVRTLLAPLSAIPKAGVLEHQALQLLQTEVGIPLEMASSMIAEGPIETIPRGFELFEGRPPFLPDLPAVERFLGVDHATITALNRRERLPRPQFDYGYDIDEVLDAQRFLQHGLLTIPEQYAVIGATMQVGDTLQDWFIEPWNPANGTDRRVEVENFLRIQRKLMAKFVESARAEPSLSLGEIAARTTHPSSTVLRGVMWILNGTIAKFGWSAPFRWVDLTVLESFSPSLLAGTEQRSQ